MRGPSRAILFCSLAICFTAPIVGAQPLEVGGSIGTSCKGSDGSFCNDTHSGLRTAGPYVSVFFNDRVEVSGRVAWLRQPDVGGRILPEPLTFAITDRRRVIAQGEISWHFRSGKRVRPVFGLGFGAYRDREFVTCQPAGCEGQLFRSGLTAGETLETHRDTSILAGLSVKVHERVRVHGGWRYHNPFKDELALSEAFIAIGFRPF